MAQRILIMNDDTHDDRFCFENGDRGTVEDALSVLMPAHSEDYEWQRAYLPDIEEAFARFHPDFDADDVGQCVENMFNNIMWDSGVDPENYTASFNEVWELASCV